MVKKRLGNLHSSEGSTAQRLDRDVSNLRKLNLRKVTSKKEIKEICFTVIDAVERLILVHVNEQEILSRKVKKQKGNPISYNDTERWNTGAKIREDWGSTRWLKNPPRGWVYYNEDGSLLGTIYEGANKGEYETFIHRDIAENPYGALVLIKAMKKKLLDIVGDIEK